MGWPKSLFATRKLNPGESMVMTASGRDSSIAAMVWRSRRASVGSFGSTSARPMTESSAMGKRLRRPASFMVDPPIPE